MGFWSPARMEDGELKMEPAVRLPLVAATRSPFSKAFVQSVKLVLEFLATVLISLENSAVRKFSEQVEVPFAR